MRERCEEKKPVKVWSFTKPAGGGLVKKTAILGSKKRQKWLKDGHNTSNWGGPDFLGFFLCTLP